MTKKSPQQRKDTEKQYEIAKERMRLSQDLLEAVKEKHERKLQPDLYKPGLDWEERMKYQGDKQFLEACRKQDAINAKFEEMKIEDQINHYQNEAARYRGEMKERD